MYTKFLTS